ncbi:MAG: YheC/YheD family protein, partial [Deltaproteobacteria bacterium]|jgi:glutathione synthase/RimK-type ligase-like ATP-grasp enzyme|nr:YheC/YheD family protein [Deltaproteobacteria bacterium]
LLKEIPYNAQLLGGKAKVFQYLSRDEELKKYIIPYDIVRTPDAALRFADAHERIVLKPVRGSQGRKAFSIARVAHGDYELVADHDTTIVSAAELKAKLEKILDRNYIAQRYVASRTSAGMPYDIRVHTCRGKDAKWTIVKVYARCGIAKNLTSNLAGGGASADAEDFLPSHFGPERGRRVYEKIHKLGQMLPERLQKLYDHPLNSLGIDIGVDADDAIYLFEVNSRPGSAGFYLEHAVPVVDYAIHVATAGKGRHGAEADTARNVD